MRPWPAAHSPVGEGCGPTDRAMGRMREINMEFTCFQPTISRKVDISALRGVVDIVEPVTSRIAARSLTEATYAALRSDVITGRVPPGTRLPAAQIASERGISLNVVREALNRLAGEGLVIAAGESGKAKTALQFIGILSLMLGYPYRFHYGVVDLGMVDLVHVGRALIYISLFYSLLSAAQYVGLFASAVEAKIQREKAL